MWTTVLVGVVLSGVVVALMSVGVIFKKKTPMKEKGCAFMCKHGKDKQCACSSHPPAPHKTLADVALEIEN